MVWERPGAPGSLVLSAPFQRARYITLPPLYAALMIACGHHHLYSAEDITAALLAAPLAAAPQLLMSDTIDLGDLRAKGPSFVHQLDLRRLLPRLLFGINLGLDLAQPIQRTLPIGALIEFAGPETILEFPGRGPSTIPPNGYPSVVFFAKTTPARLFIISTSIT